MRACSQRQASDERTLTMLGSARVVNAQWTWVKASCDGHSQFMFVECEYVCDADAAPCDAMAARPSAARCERPG